MQREVTIRLDKKDEKPLHDAIKNSLEEIKEKIKQRLFLKNEEEPQFKNKNIYDFAQNTAGVFTKAIVENTADKKNTSIKDSYVNYTKEKGNNVIELNLYPSAGFKQSFEKEKDRVPYLIKQMTDIDKNSAKQLFDKLTAGETDDN